MSNYNREKAVEYAHTWAFGRNPQYLDFSSLGGDCANFASQCLYAGTGVMNYTPVMGWYYKNSNDRTPSWTGVQYLQDFLLGAKTPGPKAVRQSLVQMEPGDIVQLATNQGQFYHTLVVVENRGDGGGGLLVACHTYDSDYRPLSTYEYDQAIFMHIV